jgi:hypothetical protein
MTMLSRFPVRTLSLAALLIFSNSALAQDHARIACSECRDPNVHPSDFGNAAFNAARVPGSGFSFDQLDVIEVINPDGQWAWVDLDFEMLTINLGFKLPTFIIPTGNIIIEVTDPTGRLTSYAIDLDVPNELAVGTGYGPGYNPGADSNTPGGGSSGGGGDYIDSGDYWDGWENGYGGQSPWTCEPDFSEPNVTTVRCSIP